ncbi:hypothetical protein PoB_000780800 [Plakobranchus ocellatus]|uniref:Uncharacterized protein n=1 Tax=Plakobranchus ocellatus TaxID=259542 RepID=A0AAV3YFQ3_9GAST|nr:hypothetical protein PoB_000780800 [Plakobranchus ocellatus]
MGDTLFKLPLTTCTVRWVDSIPDSTWEEKEVEDSRRRSRQDDSTGKEVGIEDKSQVEKEMSPCPEREAVHRRQPALVASYDPRQPRWGQFFPGAPHGGRRSVSQWRWRLLILMTGNLVSANMH